MPAAQLKCQQLITTPNAMGTYLLYLELCKSRKLNYLSQMSFDTANHAITDIGAEFADQKDGQHIQKITLRLSNRLFDQGVQIHNVLADTGYSSGENYAFFEEQGLTAYIPPHGQYKGGPKGFIYHKEEKAQLLKTKR